MIIRFYRPFLIDLIEKNVKENEMECEDYEELLEEMEV